MITNTEITNTELHTIQRKPSSIFSFEITVILLNVNIGLIYLSILTDIHYVDGLRFLHLVWLVIH